MIHLILLIVVIVRREGGNAPEHGIAALVSRELAGPNHDCGQKVLVTATGADADRNGGRGSK